MEVQYSCDEPLLKKQTIQLGKWDLFFWRDLRGLETNFLVHRGGNCELIEAKFSENPEVRDAAKLEKVAEILGSKNVQKKTIISRTPQTFPVGTPGTVPVFTIPLSEWEG